jgi:hypothetical protein
MALSELVGVAVRLRAIESGQIVVGEPLPEVAGFGDSVVAHRGSSS